MHVALYRKYRSATFDDVWGQDHITSVLKYQAKSGRVSHAYLFCGSRGTGKTSCAKILAKAVNCENPKDGNPCGECAACRLIDSGGATDVMEMDAASETGVDYIRSIKEEVRYSPLMLKKKVYIIDEVHMLSESAFNALLKTLEEPPEHVVFVLATTEVHKIPATVVSRCQRFDFRRLPVEILSGRLEYIAENEGIALEPDAAQMIAKQAQGGMRDAISLFELCSGGGADVTAERVFDILGVSGYESVSKTAEAVSRKDAATLFDSVAAVVSSSKDISVFWQELMSFYRDMMIAKYAENPAEYLDLTETEAKILTQTAEMFTMSELFYHSKILDEAMRDMARIPQNKRVICEFALMRMCDASLDSSSGALSARVEALEKTVSLLQSRLESGNFVKADGGDSGTFTPTSAKASEEVTKKDSDSATASPLSEDAGGAPAVKAPQKAAAKPSAGGFQRVPDLSEVADIMGKSDLMCRSILGESRAEVSPDGTVIRIITANAFAPVYFDDALCRALSDAFLSCKITDKTARVEIIVQSDERRSPSDELFDM